METTFFSPIRIPSGEQLACQGQQRWKQYQPGDSANPERIPLLQDARQEKFVAVICRSRAKVSGGEKQYFGMSQPFEQPHPLTRRATRLVGGKIFFKSLPLLGRKPACVAGTVFQSKQNDQAEQDRRDTPKNVEHLPALQSPQFSVVNWSAIDDLVCSNLKQRVGNLGADDLSDWRSNNKPGQCPRPI